MRRLSPWNLSKLLDHFAFLIAQLFVFLTVFWDLHDLWIKLLIKTEDCFLLVFLYNVRVWCLGQSFFQICSWDHYHLMLMNVPPCKASRVKIHSDNLTYYSFLNSHNVIMYIELVSIRNWQPCLTGGWCGERFSFDTLGLCILILK